MIDNKRRMLEKQLQRIEIQLGSVSGIKGRHVLLKKQIVLKKELKALSKR
jgi:hypothetical protein